MLHVELSIGRDDAAHGGNLLAEAGGTATLPSLEQCGGICHRGGDMSGVHADIVRGQTGSA